MAINHHVPFVLSMILSNGYAMDTPYLLRLRKFFEAKFCTLVNKVQSLAMLESIESRRIGRHSLLKDGHYLKQSLIT